MSPLSDEYIRSLEPESLRYDVTIFDDFVISVLPNGIKTWAFLYDYEGRKRRKTLGVYPDMSYAQAEDALDNARNMIARLGDDIKGSAVEDDAPVVVAPGQIQPQRKPEQRPAVLAGGLRRRSQKRKRKRPSIRLPMIWVKRVILGALGAGALALAAFFLVRLDLFSAADDTPETPAVTDNPPTPARNRPRPIVPDDDAAGGSPAAAPTRGGQTTPRRAAPQPIIIDDPAPAAPAGPEDESSAVADEPEQPTQAQAAPETGSRPPAVSVASTAPDGADATPPAAADDAEAAVTPGKPLPMTAKPDPPVSASTEPTRTADVAPPSSSAPTEASTTNKTDSDATAGGGEVSRAIITSNVVDLEPVDDLGQNLALDDGGYRTVFYFTELRNFTAGQIVHRWTHDGRVIADVPLRVGGGWRWRTYSSKDLLPGMTGDWSVAVIDRDGQVLGEREFRFDR